MPGEVRFEDARVGGVGGELQAIGVVQRLLARLHQRRDVMALDMVGRGLAVVADDGPVFAVHPAYAARPVDVALFGVDEMFACRRPAMQRVQVFRGGLAGLEQPPANILPAGEAADRLPAGAGREIASLDIEHGDEAGCDARAEHELLHAPIA